jgi:hypothetical protein
MSAKTLQRGGSIFLYLNVVRVRVCLRLYFVCLWYISSMYSSWLAPDVTILQHLQRCGVQYRLLGASDNDSDSNVEPYVAGSSTMTTGPYPYQDATRTVHVSTPVATRYWSTRQHPCRCHLLYFPMPSKLSFPKPSRHRSYLVLNESMSYIDRENAQCNTIGTILQSSIFRLQSTICLQLGNQYSSSSSHCPSKQESSSFVLIAMHTAIVKTDCRMKCIHTAQFLRTRTPRW